MIYKKTNNILIDSIKKQWLWVVLALVFATSASLLEGLTATLIMPLLQSLGNNSSEQLQIQIPNFLNFINVFYSQFTGQDKLKIIIISFLSITIFKNFNIYISILNINRIKLKTGFFIRKKCIDRFLKLDISFYNQNQTGQILSYVNEHVQYSERLTAAILQIIRNLITITVLMLVLFVLSPILTFASLVILLIVVQGLKPIIKRVRDCGRIAALSIENFSTIVTEMISGIRIIKTFNAENRELKHTERILQQRYAAEFSAHKYSSLVYPLTETMGICILLFLLAVGSGLVISSVKINLALLLTYLFALLRIIPRITHLNSLRSEISLYYGSLDSITHFLTSTEKFAFKQGDYIYKDFASKITFEDITFTFPGNSEPSLRGINFSIFKGQKIALVGSSGSGKSTILDLIMQFYKPISGVIKVDNIDLQQIETHSWLKLIAMVNQDTFLFHASVKDNIAYGYPEATKEEIIEATKQAYAYEFIQELPHGFETIVGNRGTKLSGGQRQRIAIARAILCKPQILILDEATSALDTKSEAIVQKAIDQVSQERTMIIIAHRLSTIEKSDLILVLKDGQIIEQGNHQQLMKQHGEYYSLYKAQIRTKELINH